MTPFILVSMMKLLQSAQNWFRNSSATPAQVPVATQPNMSGIRISNLDSTEQADTWRTMTHNFLETNDLDSTRLWHADSHVCEQIIERNPLTTHYFAQILRTAYVTNQKITLTYQEVLDGVFFLAFGPKNINTLLGLSFKDQPAIYIRTHNESHRTLADALVSSLTERRDNKIYIKSSFESAALASSEALYEVARSRPENPVALPTDFAQHDDFIEILGTALEKTYELSPGSLSLLTQRWHEWIDACDKGIVVFQQKDDSVGTFDFADQLSIIPSELFESHIERLLKNDVDLKRTAGKIADAISQPLRSNAFSTLNEIFPNDTYDKRHEAHTYARDLYQYVYQMALANQYNCILMTVEDPHSTADVKQNAQNVPITQNAQNVFIKKYSDYLAQDSVRNHNFASTSGETTQSLGFMPATYFTTFLYKSSKAIDTWRAVNARSDKHKIRVARQLDYAVKLAAEQINRTDEIHSTILRGAIAILLAVVGWLLDEFQFGGNGGVILSAAIAFLIAVGPEIVDMIKSLKEINDGPHTFFAQY